MGGTYERSQIGNTLPPILAHRCTGVVAFSPTSLSVGLLNDLGIDKAFSLQDMSL